MVIHNSDKKVRTIEDIDDIQEGKRFIVLEERKNVYKVLFNGEERYIPKDKCIEIFKGYSKEKHRESKRQKDIDSKKKRKRVKSKSSIKRKKTIGKRKKKKPIILFTPMGNNIR